jgi:molecular chaperone GrpE (heat shock protein)
MYNKQTKHNNFKPPQLYLTKEINNMSNQEQTPDPISTLLAEFSTRLNEVEEKQRLLRDRALLIGENLISTKEDHETENHKVKKEISLINSEIKTLKTLMKRVINELENFARKTELDTLKNQSKMFQPLELARIKDVERMIKEALIENTSKK